MKGKRGGEQDLSRWDSDELGCLEELLDLSFRVANQWQEGGTKGVGLEEDGGELGASGG